MQSCQDPLKKFQKNPVGKLMEDDIFGRFSGRSGTSEKVLLFFRTECSETEIRVQFLQSHPWYSFRLSRPFFGERNRDEIYQSFSSSAGTA